jgi:glycosyltransferase involved in cell wall biosynthesis
MHRETITVVIPVFNGGQFIANAIDSALGQTVPPTQIIVINDGSTDDTNARLLPYRDRLTLIDQANQGAAAARNAGLRIATGEFIAFLDADDVWHPRKLEIQLQLMLRRPEIQLIGTETFDYPCTGAPDISADADIEEISRDRLLVRNYFTASSVMLHREIITRLGGFDTSVSSVEDFDYWQRVAEIGIVAILKSPLTGYRRVAGSVSCRPAGVEQGLRRILQKLDERDSWHGRRWMRRKAISHLHYSISHLHGAAGSQRLSLWEVLQSLAWYPLPFHRSETGVALSRLKRTIFLLLQLLGFKCPKSPLAAGGSVGDV